jgi:hypothetical protein
MKMTYDYAFSILLFDFKRLGVSASLCLSCNSSATSVLLLPHVGISDNFLINVATKRQPVLVPVRVYLTTPLLPSFL